MSSSPVSPCPDHSNVLYQSPTTNSYIISCNTNFLGNDLLFLHADTLVDCLKQCDNYAQDPAKANGAICVAVTFGTPNIQNNCYLKYAASSVSSVSASSNLQSARRQDYEIGQAPIIDSGQLGGRSGSVTSTVTATNSADNVNTTPATKTPILAPSSQASSTAAIPSTSVLQPARATSSTTVVVYKSVPSAPFISSVVPSSRPAAAFAISNDPAINSQSSSPRISPSNYPMPLSTTSPGTTSIYSPSTLTPSSTASSPPSYATYTQPQSAPHPNSKLSLALKLGLAISLSSVLTLALLFAVMFVFFRRRRQCRRRISLPQQLPPTTLSALYPIPPPAPPPKNHVSHSRLVHELGATVSNADAELAATTIKPVSPLRTWKRPRTLAKAELEAPGFLDMKALAESPGWRDLETRSNASEGEKRFQSTTSWDTGKETLVHNSSFHSDLYRGEKKDLE